MRRSGQRPIAPSRTRIECASPNGYCRSTTRCPSRSSAAVSSAKRGSADFSICTSSGNQGWCIRGAATASSIGSPYSNTPNTTDKTVLMIVRPPGLPVTSTARPSRATTVGDCELSIRLPGAITLAGVPIAPCRSVTPGCQLKSHIWLLSRNPAPRTTTCEPNSYSSV